MARVAAGPTDTIPAMIKRSMLGLICIIVLGIVLVQWWSNPPTPQIFANLSFEAAQAAAEKGGLPSTPAANPASPKPAGASPTAPSTTPATPPAPAKPKLLVVAFSAGWCTYCKRMDRSVWTDPEVVRWLRENAIAIKVDFDADKARARAFGITAVPTVLIFDGKREVGRASQYLSPSQLLEKLRGARAGT